MRIASSLSLGPACGADARPTTQSATPWRCERKTRSPRRIRQSVRPANLEHERRDPGVLGATCEGDGQSMPGSLHQRMKCPSARYLRASCKATRAQPIVGCTLSNVRLASKVALMTWKPCGTLWSAHECARPPVRLHFSTVAPSTSALWRHQTRTAATQRGRTSWPRLAITIHLHVHGHVRLCVCALSTCNWPCKCVCSHAHMDDHEHTCAHLQVHASSHAQVSICMR